MRNPFALVALGLSTMLVVLTPAAAHAGFATSCSFDAGTATVTAVIGSGDNATLIRNGSAIDFDGAPCGAATVTNTDQINISAPDPNTAETLTISEAQGTFAPGKTPEPDGSDEIEIGVTGLTDMNETLRFVGTSDADTITVGYTGTDLLPGTPGEPEVTYPAAVNTKEVDSGGGDDTVWMDRAYASVVNAGDGNDTIIAGCFLDSTYDGGPGDDTMSYDECDPAIGLTVHSLGAGSATATRDDGNGMPGVDDLAGIEQTIGTPENDTFFGSTSGTDRFDGVGGNDRFYALGADDTVDGGDGIDRFSFAASTVPVDVNLTDLTSIGDGTDSFANVEAIEGSPQADRFTGDPRTSGVIFIDGYGGRDMLDLRTATHRQFVWTTPDETNAPPTWARLEVRSIRRIQGSDRSDRIEVGDVNGNELRARFSGNGGDDLLVGGIHHDVLRGGPGDDTLDGNGRRDICYGGSGVNTYINC
jgi:Ca2+-binding RTX toxin-like protein